MPGTYGKTWWREGYACGCMIQSIEDVIEPRLAAAGYPTPVNIYQEGYNTSVSASAGTHAGGGVLDCQRGDDGELTIWRECGVAMWPRGAPYDSMDVHQHGVWIGCPHLADEAADQVYDYKCGRNGLANNGADPGPDVPYITWQDAYDKYHDAADEGILGMTELEREHCSKDRVIKPSDSEWSLILINDDDDSTFVTGPCTFVAEAFLQVTGLPPGDDPLRVRFGRFDGDDACDYYSQTEIFGSGGTTFGHVSLVNWVPEDTKLRLYCQSPHQITITDVSTSCLHD